MNILILGAYESNNLGDAVICQSVAHMIQKHLPDATLTIRDLLQRDRKKEPGPANFKTMKQMKMKNHICSLISKYTPVDLVYVRQQRRLELHREYLDQLLATSYDLAVFAGGQMFMDTYALFLCYCVRGLEKKGTPVIFHACGTGPFHSPSIGKQLGQALAAPNVHSISCRDDVATVRKLLKGSAKTVFETFDPALDTAEVYGMVKDRESCTIGLGVMYSEAFEEEQILTFWQSVIRLLNQKQIKWKLFTNGAVIDQALAEKLLSSIPEYKGKIDRYLVPRDREPEGLVRTIAQFSGLISFRLHSHILGASLDIPSIALVWDEKLPFFFRKIGHPERCFKISDPVENILQELERAMIAGYDRLLLEKQIQTAEKTLMEAVIECVEKGETR